MQQRKPLYHLLWTYSIAAILLYWPSAGIAQPGDSDFELQTRRHGLSHNYITGILQDEKGYVWVSTLKGLNRYDGTEYFHVPLSQFRCNDEYGDVRLMKYFGNNEIAIATNRGCYSFNSLTLRYQSFIVPPVFGSGYVFNRSRDIEKANDSVYLVSTGTGFYTFNKNGSLRNRKDVIKVESVGVAWFQFGGYIQPVSKRYFIQENREDYFLYDNKTGGIRHLMHPEGFEAIRGMLSPDSSLNRIRFFPDRRNGLLVFNRIKNSLDHISDIEHPVVDQSIPLPFSVLNEINWQSGLFHLTDSSFAVSVLGKGFFLFHRDPVSGKISVNNTRYLPEHFITGILLDRSQRWWIGTDKGLLKQSVNKQIIHSVNLQQIAGSQLALQLSAIKAVGKELYIGTRQYTGLLILDAETKQLIRRVDFGKIKNRCNYIISIIHSPADPNILWIGTDAGLVWYNISSGAFGRLEGNGLPVWVNDSRIRRLFTDSKGNDWFQVNQFNTLICYHRDQKRFSSINPKTAGLLFRIALCAGLGEDIEGNIWIAGEGVCRLNTKTWKVDSLIPQLPGVYSPHTNISIFNTDKDHLLWLTTPSGIYRWDPVNGKHKLFTTANGLADNIGLGNAAVDPDHIFVHSYNGLSWLDKRSGKTIVLTEKDGLPESGINATAVLAWDYNAERKEYLFGYENYLVLLPARFEQKTVSPQSFQVSRIRVMTKDSSFFNPSTVIRLPYNQNDICINFSAVNYFDPENQSYAYRISEEDAEWMNIGSQNLLYLNNLGQGKHTIQVKLMSVNHRWPDQFAEVTIEIIPPFWNENWFYILLSALVALLVFFIFRRRIKNIRQRANLDKQLAQTEMKALHAQMNPHFVFNCLNSINEMILLNDNTQASHYLSKFAQLIRATLDHSTREWISLRQTIDYLQRYIELEKIRKDDFTFSLEVDKALNENETYLPPMLIQPLLENAIWHGKTKDNPLHIHISFRKNNSQLLCIVSDNGIGIEESQKNKHSDKLHKSIGITNIQQRIRLLNEKYNLQSGLVVEDRKGNLQSGTVATLSLPLKISDV